MTPLMSRVLLALVAALGPMAASGQNLSAELARISNGDARLSFQVRPAVCGDGGSVIFADRKRYTWPNTETVGEFPRARCVPGFGRVLIRRRAGQTVGIQTMVGGEWPRSRGSGVDLGFLRPAIAMDFFFDIADSAAEPVASQAVMPGAIAAATGLVRRLSDIATNPRRPEQVRLRAINWLGQAGEREAIPILRQIAWNRAAPMSVRSRSLKAMWEAHETDLLAEFVQSIEPLELRISAIGWLGQTPTLESAKILQSVICDAGASSSLRATAILAYARMKRGVADPVFLKTAYSGLRTSEEKMALIRSLAEQDDSDSRSWVVTFSKNTRHPESLRRFALERLRDGNK